ncbi:MAG TPA: divergent polysaccharide deacetylase family protein [bacterium]|nr:divergent polysaccharide deacetylase family protein [bacterium]
MVRALAVVLVVAAAVGTVGPAPGAGRSASAAIVLVHAGASLAALAPIYAMRRPFGLGIRPRQPYSVEISKDAPAHGLEAVLDLPVGTAGSAVPAITARMSDDEIRRTTLDDLVTAPGVVGLRADAGAYGVPNARVLRDVLQVVRARGAWFLAAGDDDSGASAIARELGVPVLVVTDDLDATPTPDAIAAGVRRLITRARGTGMAIGVARLETPAPSVIGALLSEFDRAGVRLVPPSVFLR